MSIILKN